MKVSSSADAARDAVSGVVKVDASGAVRPVVIAPGSVAGMSGGAAIAVRISTEMSALVSVAKGRASSVTDLASIIEQRDSHDSWTWSV